MVLVLVTVAALRAVGAGEPNWRFSKGSSNEFNFDTGVLRGVLRAGGKSMGLSSVTHVPSGTRLDRSMGLFSHYRVFTSNHRYGTAAWDWPSEAELGANGSVKIHWPATPDRPFELRAVYRWTTPDTLDLETSVEAKGQLEKFESFLASYFGEEFTNCLIYVGPSADDAHPQGFMAAERSFGVWQAFPRDELAVAIIQDGRWKIEPNPVNWFIMPRLARPLGIRRSPTTGLTAVLMAPTQDCFALLTPHQSEPHDSLYLCLFGRDLKPGEHATARARLRIGSQLSEPDCKRAYDDYVKALPPP